MHRSLGVLLGQIGVMMEWTTMTLGEMMTMNGEIVMWKRTT